MNEFSIMLEYADWKLIASIVSAIAAIASWVTIVYKEFLQEAKLDANFDQIGLLRCMPNISGELTHEMFITDLLSSHPSRQAQDFLTQEKCNPHGHHFQILEAIKSQDSRQVSLALEQRSVTCGQMDYSPPDELITQYLKDKRLSTNFYVPLTISNSGRKIGYVSSLVLIAQSESSTDKWAYKPFVTIDTIKLLDRRTPQNDRERIEGPFFGVTIPPLDSVQITPWFIPIHEIANSIVSRTNMAQGQYKIRIIGYGKTKRKPMFITDWIQFQLDEKILLQAFRGSDATIDLAAENYVVDAISRS